MSATEIPSQTDHPAFEIIGGAPTSGVLIVCDHASNAVPPHYDNLGLDAAQFSRHIGYDIGAAAVTRHVAAALRAPAVLSRFSRLLIDPNRGEDDPTLIMRLSDGAIIPGNRDVDAPEREARLAQFYTPYHAAITHTLDHILDAQIRPVILSIHTFTAHWKGVPRPWEIGILWDRDPRLVHPLLSHFRAVDHLNVGDNQPYTGALHGDTMWKHGTQRGLAHAIVEIRQDLVATPDGQRHWAAHLSRIMMDILAEPETRAQFALNPTPS